MRYEYAAMCLACGTIISDDQCSYGCREDGLPMYERTRNTHARRWIGDWSIRMIGGEYFDEDHVEGRCECGKHLGHE